MLLAPCIACQMILHVPHEFTDGGECGSVGVLCRRLLSLQPRQAGVRRGGLSHPAMFIHCSVLSQGKHLT